MRDGLQVALFEPDRPHNLGMMLRLGACLDVAVDVIEPCGFPLDDRRIRFGALDYLARVEWCRHQGCPLPGRVRAAKRRLVLLAAASLPYHRLAFRDDDILLLGRESAGVPDKVRDSVDCAVRPPLRPGLRSLNVVTAAAIVLGEALRQTGCLETWRTPPHDRHRPPGSGTGLVRDAAGPDLRRLRGDRGRLPPAGQRGLPPGRFERQPWDRPGGGGGVMGVMRGRVFEKVGVNVSTVWGERSPRVREGDPGAEDRAAVLGQRHLAGGPPAQPHCPPAHEHPPHPHRTDLVRRRRRPQPHLSGRGRHRRLRPAQGRLRCQRSHLVSARYKAWADEYFFIPHRNEARRRRHLLRLSGRRHRAGLRLPPGPWARLPRHLPAAGAPAHGPALDGRGATAPAGPPRALR